MSQILGELLAQDTALLASALTLEASTARLEVQTLWQRVLGVNRAYLFAHSERSINPIESYGYNNLFQRRLAGEPLAYVLGEREFFGLNLSVTSATLIPRADTELLVELALQQIPTNVSFRVLDLGTGSGAIALAIAQQRPKAQVFAADQSSAALAVARTNAQRLQLCNLQFLESNWFSAFVGQRFELIVSNPPYIADHDVHLAQGDLRFEPRSALVSGRDGLDDIRHIIQHAAAHLESAGWLWLEHGYEQAAAVRALLIQAGFDEVQSARDLSGIERCSGGRKTSPTQEL
jgi:release factor glutamine methyltransferase